MTASEKYVAAAYDAAASITIGVLLAALRGREPAARAAAPLASMLTSAQLRRTDPEASRLTRTERTGPLPTRRALELTLELTQPLAVVPDALAGLPKIRSNAEKNGVGGFMVYRRVMQTVTDLEARQIAPLREKVDGILADVRTVTARVSHQTERVDHAISGTMERVDETAERVKVSVVDKMNQAIGIARGVRAVIMSVMGRPVTDH